ncbi:hypothetical protein B4071_3116 [Bacillus subtilis]|uniref:Uncharacterized protein n=1 Tax=Bacillus subtilis TaxID=1423 RepID=A0A0C3JZV3_BACIU|nr:hypothetical protein B4070_3120 [Bacillus subtilis]KIN32755.1 hypothetical protein B4069_3062 [Bacillus subtilis]KIN34236.1 hypothetical protein B4071_3116 [Bacillus subtilis]KIN43329.1 hypothetical protein B4072_3083 [Bacillus subtilis]KIU13426.1 hypothetical protein SC09_Contig17orf00676 [Bacillus subtilis]
MSRKHDKNPAYRMRGFIYKHTKTRLSSFFALLSIGPLSGGPM